jgi:ubiquinone/menaquinone biosynthesis C-methylase UbiE
MSMKTNRAIELHSAGHATLCGSFWLDAHFAVRMAECEAAVRSVGIQPGWRVLDAGCGTGPFLPWLAELVGPGGRLAAIDLAASHIERVRAHAHELACPVDARVSSILELPFADRSFDAVWTSYTSEYLTDAQLVTALAELRRVTKVGGVVAVLDNDAHPFRMGPVEMPLVWRFWDAASKTDDPISMLARGELRISSMRRWLERAGFADVSQTTRLTEFWAPLTEAQHQWVTIALDFFSSYERIGLSQADIAEWRAICDPNSTRYLPVQPDFTWCEASTLAIAWVSP